ncbi:hypothetical protein MW887_007566 [Aspergillus wentii]|nr:hypothetical protein MW887_007566 [Aspergillus wentii]
MFKLLHLLGPLLLAFSLFERHFVIAAELPRPIDRKKVVSRFNPTRNASSNTTPMQVGNGNFAFGADITGLQTFLPFNILSSWGWHNSSLPTTFGETSPSDYTGLDWWTHGRLVNYAIPNEQEPEISQWLIANPHRINLGRIGFVFLGDDWNITEHDLTDKFQELDIQQGRLESRFSINGTATTVWTWVDPAFDTVAIRVQSELLSQQNIALFFDYPYATDKKKFEAPFVGDWAAVSNHTTELFFGEGEEEAQTKHKMDNTTYFTALHWNGNASITRNVNSHRYILQPDFSPTGEFEITATFSSEMMPQEPSDVTSVSSSSKKWWKDYWETGSFIDLTTTGNTTAIEIQRRIILSQYLLAVNEAGDDPPQESGLVNNGWYGKFHMEMYLWHSAHWIPWGRYPLLERSIGVYERFLSSSIDRAKEQGYDGARWGKMSDPSGRSAPGEINSLLIWQQPHIFYFAEMEYKFTCDDAQKRKSILSKWDNILSASADFMASFAFWNTSTGVYDLGPPMYPASENTPPNSTINPTFELAYWRFGLETAIAWKEHQGKPAPSSWKHVVDHLAPLPTVAIASGLDDELVTTYTLYEGIPDMWTDPETVTDHPMLAAIYGLLPASRAVSRSIAVATAEQVARVWNFTDCWGWDFPMLALNAAQVGDVDAAMRYLVDENLAFDDVGMPVGPGDKAPTPYFPASAGLLFAVGMLAGGWIGGEASDVGQGGRFQRLVPGFPAEWEVDVEGFERML